MKKKISIQVIKPASFRSMFYQFHKLYKSTWRGKSIFQRDFSFSFPKLDNNFWPITLNNEIAILQVKNGEKKFHVVQQNTENITVFTKKIIAMAKMY